MSKGTVNQVIQRAVSDAAFRRQLQRDPQSALAGFDLTTDERSAITSGDPSRLTALGVDQRMSKAFGLGGMADVSKVVAGDTTSGSAAFIDESTSGATHGLVGDTTSGSAALLGDTTSGSAALLGDTTSGSAALISPDGAHLDAGIIGDDSSGAAAAITGDPGSAGSAAFATPDGYLGQNVEGPTIDEGIVGGSDAAAPASFGTQVITGDQQDALSAFETDPGDTATDASIAGPDDASSTLAQTDSDWMPTFDGHVDDVNQQQ